MNAKKADALLAISGVGLAVAVIGVAVYFMGDHSPKAISVALGGIVVVFVGQVIYGMSSNE